MANLISRILCPVDLSDQSRHALDYGVGLQRHFKASLTAVYVIPPAVPPLATFEMPSAAAYVYTPEDLDAIDRKVQAFTNANRPDVHIETRVVEGYVVREILDLADAVTADVIVIGTRGRGGVSRFFLGSVAERVIGGATCPVLAIPPRMPDAAPIGPQLFTNVLCAIDFSPASLKALGYARAFAAESKANLTLIHVAETSIEEPALAEPVHPGAHESLLVTAARRRLQHVLTADVAQQENAQVVVRTEKAYRGILAAAAELHSDLIVLGAHGGVANALGLGSTTNHVLRDATCPVLTVRA